MSAITFIQSKFGQLAALLDGRPATERGLIIITACLVIYTLLHLALLSPVEESNAAMRQSIESKTAEKALLDHELVALMNNLDKAPKESVLVRLEALRNELNNTGEFSTLMKELISPREMVRFVEGVLTSNKGITVVRAKNLTPVQLWPDHSNEVNNESGDSEGEEKNNQQKTPTKDEFRIYKHGMLLEVKGRYLELVTFLVTLEQLPWKILWGDVSLSSDDDDNDAVSRLVIYTLSPEKAWMGL